MSKHYVVITYYSDGTEQVQDCRDEESAEVDYLLQRDEMSNKGSDHIERVRMAVIVKDSQL